MPKVIGTRKQKAAELLAMLERGPASIGDHPELHRKYRLWAETWIIPAVKQLVPELKAKTSINDERTGP